MGVINNYSDLVNRLTGGNNGNPQHPFFFIDNRIGDTAGPSTSSGQHTTLWRLNKSNGAAGDILGASRTCDKSTLGAMPYNDAGAGRELRLLGMETVSMLGGVLIMYDRLADAGNFSALSTTPNVVNLVPSRNTDGIGNEIWIEIQDQVGTTSVFVTATYTNQDGVTKTTPQVAFGGSSLREDARIIRLPLAKGDRGVKSVTSVQLSGSTGTAGIWGVLLVRPVTMALCESAGSASFRDYVTGTPILPKLDNNACYAFALLSSTGTALRMMVALHIIEA